MTDEQLIAKFNPANGSNLSAEDLELLHNLTDKQIDVLADAYPNTPNRRAYLRIYDKNLPANKQLYQLSTWQNIRNVRKFSAKKNLIPWDFFTTAQNLTAQLRAQKPTAKAGAVSPKKVVVDLTAKEAADELKNATGKPAAGKADEKKSPAKTAGKGGGGKGKKAAEAVTMNESANDSHDGGDGSETFTSGE